ncbi:T9SS type A sorting domain-containing protein [Seonamhaeicola marinus]|uniref:T9SS type A sorting domain-containing protein n=1 Tax=Seonamhaeicola marinus TaxID=1912246 RepID=A0A5D0HRE8_9FLAO|nr:T9SS type A sorting domain-containing protein [Seonamhaeicola marinus]TYA73904.1 T9SS type A sorting domain-containing protein [Seonamhaeicola marinus]
MKGTRIKIFPILFFISQFALSQTTIDVNLNVKHAVGGVDTFDRHKFVNFHSTVNQNNWNTDNKFNNVIGDLLGNKDVYIGRNTGTISWHLRNNIDEDPSRPGFANPASIALYGQQNRNSYAGRTWAHQYEDKDDQILCTQIHPFYPDGKTTNKGWSFSQTNTASEPIGTASGEFLALYIKEFYGTGGVTGKPKPNFVEITNEPLWDLVTTADTPHDLTEVFTFHKTVAEEIHKVHNDVQVGGYCAAFPDFDKNNFQRWHDRDKHFMDIAGEEMDFWTIHLYDFPSIGGKSKYRKGSNMEATMDMLEQYSMLKFDKVKPLMVSEYNAQTHDYNGNGHSPYTYWLKLKSSVSMMMQFMERADKINYAMPFFMLKAEWQYNAGVGPTSVHGSRMMRRENEPNSYTGDFIYTEAILLYDLLADVKGTRVDSFSDNLDIMVDAYVQDNKAYVLVNNLDFVSHELNLNLFGNLSNATNIEVRHLRLNGTSDSSPPILDVNNYSTFNNDLTIAPEGTYVIEFTFPSNIEIDELSEETKYYSDAYLKQISANASEIFNINGVNLADNGEAVLRVGVGRNHGLSLTPNIMLNGSSIAIPDNIRGDDQEDRDNFFGVLEIPIPYDLIQENNEIEVSFSDNGGHISTVTLQVFNFSSNIREFDPSKLPASNYKIKGIGATCVGENNGVIDIVTTFPHNYKVNVSGPNSYNENFDFNNSLNIQDLEVGTYTVTITITEYPDYSIQFVIEIGEPEPLSVTSKISDSKDSITLNLGGSTKYYIELNGKEIQTSANVIRLDLKNGTNTIAVRTDKECQGTYEETFFIDKSFFLFPNPVRDELNVVVSENLMHSKMKIYSVVGNLVKKMDITRSRFNISVDHLKQGVYFISFEKNEERVGYSKFVVK